MVKMPYKFKRDCPVCGKPELLSLSDHLRQVHRLKSHERKQWLKAAVFSGSKKRLGITPVSYTHLTLPTSDLV